MPNSWTTPSEGLPGHPLDACLRIELDFAENPDPSALCLWEAMALLCKILGDHKLELFTLDMRNVASDPSGNCLGWRADKHGCSLKTSLAALSNKKIWLDSRAAFNEPCFISVLRGVRAERHLVWWLEFHPRTGPYRPYIELAISVAHLTTDALPIVQSLIDVLFNIGATIPVCQAGRAAIVTHRTDFFGRSQGWSESPSQGNFHSASGAGLLHETFSWRTRLHEQAMVPYLAPINLFPPAVVRALGGPDRMSALAEQFAWIPAEPVFTTRTLPNGFLQLQFGDLDRRLLLGDPEFASITLRNPGYRWIAKEIAKSGLFLFQDPSWEAQAIREARLYRQQSAAAAAAESAASKPSRFLEQSKSDLRAELSHMWSSPPRCIRDVSVVAPLSATQRKALGLHDSVTSFWIRPNAREEAFAIYGRSTGEPAQLASPIRVGSMKADRAAFNFDVHRDGWDGESSETPDRSAARAARLRQLICPACQGRLFKARAAFEYPLDDDLADDPQAFSHREDYFTWFWLFASCASCDWSGTVADIECA